MLLFALDQEKLIHVDQASKDCIYQCLDCKGALKVRSGPFRKKHFYHLKASINCDGSGKTENHLFLQLLLKKVLKGTVWLEKPFPIIGRIADVVWEDRKIIFEIQTSSISEKEALLRCKDYGATGYHLVWILHDLRFNKRKASAAERFLRLTPCYYTNITPQKGGIFYDQLEIFKRFKRIRLSQRFPVDITKPYKMPLQINQKLPDFLTHRIKNHPLRFHGDLFSRLENPSLKKALLNLQNKPKPISYKKAYHLTSRYLQFVSFLAFID